LGLFNRSISVDVSEEDEGVLLLEGLLADRRFGEDLHVIEVKMRVAVMEGTILAIDASMPNVPMQECVEALKVVKGLEGVAIRPGFSDAVKRIVGSKWGCTHMASLIMNMGNVSVQGRAAYVRKNLGEQQASRRMADYTEELGLFDSCVCWREDGPVVRRWRAQQEEALKAAESGSEQA
jgi:hypothetical protein